MHSIFTVRLHCLHRRWSVHILLKTFLRYMKNDLHLRLDIEKLLYFFVLVLFCLTLEKVDSIVLEEYLKGCYFDCNLANFN